MSFKLESPTDDRKILVLGGFDRKIYGHIVQTPQKALSCAERRVLSPRWFRLDAQCDLWPWQIKQKGKKKRQWQTGYSPRPPTSPYRSQSLHAGQPGGLRCVVLYISRFIKIGPAVFPLWVVENRPFPITLAIGLYNSLYYRTTVQAVIGVDSRILTACVVSLTTITLVLFAKTIILQLKHISSKVTCCRHQTQQLVV